MVRLSRLLTVILLFAVFAGCSRPDVEQFPPGECDDVNSCIEPSDSGTRYPPADALFIEGRLRVSGSVVRFPTGNSCQVHGVEMPNTVPLFVAKHPDRINGEIRIGGSYPQDHECWIDFHGYALKAVKSTFDPGITGYGPVTIQKSRLRESHEPFDINVEADRP